MGVFTVRISLQEALNALVLLSTFLFCFLGPRLAFAKDDVGVTSGNFEVSLQGSANYTIPIKHTPGTAGMTPQLSLVYSSQVGPGPVGMGWSLAGLSSITRGPKNKIDDGEILGVNFTDEDALYLDGQRLVPIREFPDQSIEYKTLVDNYSRIISYPVDSKKVGRFKVWIKAGLVMDYGNSSNSNIQLKTGETLLWANSRITDTLGNYIQFKYLHNESGTFSISEASYTGNSKLSKDPYASIKFEYCELKDGCKDADGQAVKFNPPVGFLNGQKMIQSKMLIGIKSYYGSQLFREYRLKHHFTSRQSRYLLTSIQEFGPSGDSFPPTNFSYSDKLPEWKERMQYRLDIDPKLTSDSPSSKKGFRIIDINNDGILDILHSEQTDEPRVKTLLGSKTGEYLESEDYKSPILFSDLLGEDRLVQLVDLNGDDLPDIIWSTKNEDSGEIESGAFLNNGNGWDDAPTRAPPTPLISSKTSVARTKVLDLDGDGNKDFLVNDGDEIAAYIWDTPSEQYNDIEGFAPSFSTTNPWVYVLSKSKSEVYGVLTRRPFEVGRYEEVIYVLGSNGWSELAQSKMPDLDATHSAQSVFVVDFDNDGASEIVQSRVSAGAVVNTAFELVRGEWVPNANLSNLPIALFRDSGSLYPTFADLDEDNDLDISINHLGDSLQRTAYLNTSSGWVENPDYSLPSLVSSDASGKNLIEIGRVSESTSTGFISLVGQGANFEPFTVHVYDKQSAQWSKSTESVVPPIPVSSKKKGQEDRGVRFVDLDADGLVDLLYSRKLKSGEIKKRAWRNTGNGWQDFGGYSDVPFPLTDEKLGDNGIELVDITGDGLVDFIWGIQKEDGNLESYGVSINTGDGWRRSGAFAEVIKHNPLVRRKKGGRSVRFVDLDGDGLTDFIYKHYVNNSLTQSGAFKNSQGEKWEPFDSGKYTPPHELSSYSLVDKKVLNDFFYFDNGAKKHRLTRKPKYYFNRDHGAILTDVNSDGLPDLIYNHVEQYKALDHEPCYNERDLTQYEIEQRENNPSDYPHYLGNGKDCIAYANVTVNAKTVKATYLNTGEGWSASATDFIFPRRLDKGIEDQKEFLLTQDINGDGRLDVVFVNQGGSSGATETYVNTGKNWDATSNQNWKIPSEAIGSTKGQLGFVTADLNGDGLIDLAFNRCEQLDREPLYERLVIGQQVDEEGNPVFDENGGPVPIYKRSDYAVGYMEGGCVAGKETKGVFFNNGKEFVKNTAEEFLPQTPFEDKKSGDLGVRFVDVTGDGLPDAIQNFIDVYKKKITLFRWGYILNPLVNSNNELIDKDEEERAKKSAYVNLAKRVDVLNKIQNGAGVGVAIEYMALGMGSKSDNCESNVKQVYCTLGRSEYPILEVVPPIYAVHRTKMIDPSVSEDQYFNKYLPVGDRELEVNTYRYGGFRTNRETGEVLGFAWRMSKSILKPHTVLNVVHQKRHMQGMAKRNITFSGSRKVKELDIACSEHANSLDVLTCNENKWVINEKEGLPDHPNLYQVNLEGTASIKNDLQGNFLSSSEEEIEFDEYGNALSTLNKSSDGTTIESQSKYVNNTKKWYLGRLKETTVNRSNAVKNLATETVKTCFDYDDNTGLIIFEIQYCGLDPHEFETKFSYDDYGNQVRTDIIAPYDANAPPRYSGVNYDGQGRYVVHAFNTLNHSTLTKTHPVFGIATEITDPNGLVTKFELNDHGDVISRISPTGVTSKVRSEFLPNNDRGALYKIVKQSASETQELPPTETWYSRRGYVVRTITTGFSGEQIYTDSIYDNLSRKRYSSRAYKKDETMHWGWTEYDDLDRPLKVVTPDASETKFRYEGLTTYTTDALGREAKSVFDLASNPIEVYDALGSKLEHHYDVSNRLVKSVNVDGTAITHTYDIVGSKLSTTDPNLGTWTYKYNAFGELISQKDAKQQETIIEYDLLGRTVRKTELDQSSEWVYDLPDEQISDQKTEKVLNQKKGETRTRLGLLRKVIGSEGYVEDYLYDEFNRQSSTKVIALDEQFESSVEYDNLGRTIKQIYPTGFSVDNIYNQHGYFSEVKDSSTQKSFWQANEVDSFGNLTKETYGNGITTEYEFAAETNFLNSIQARNSDRALVNGFSYQYDRVGNVLSKANSFTKDRKAYNYDTLDRLIATVVDFTVSKSYAYDLNGNITNKSDFGDYSYAEESGPAHGVIKVVTTAGKEIRYRYDENGNMIRNGKKKLYYTAANRVAGIKKDWNTWATFRYSPSGVKYHQDSSDGLKRARTFYVASFEKVHEVMVPPFLPSSEHIRYRHYIMGAQGVVAIHEDVEYLFPVKHTRDYERKTSNKKPERSSIHVVQTRYLHKDNLGSLTLITDDDGAVFERLEFDPWGKRIQDPKRKSDYYIYRTGFTGHEHLDNVGLVHMNGRVYDPTLARFVSADPFVQAPNNLQNLNRYSYVLNNPLKFTDPSGFFFKKLFKGISNLLNSTIGKIGKEFGRFMKKYGRQIIITVVAVAVFYFSGGTAGGISAAMLAGAASGAAAGALTAAMYGGNIFESALKGAVLGAITGAVAGAGADIGQGLGGYANAGRAVGSGVGSGISASANGGHFEKGFVSGMVSSYAGGAFRDYGVVGAALAGGTASVLGGGKFANGAVLGAVAYLAATGLQKSMASEKGGATDDAVKSSKKFRRIRSDVDGDGVDDITFINDDPNGRSTDLMVRDELATMVEDTVKSTGLKININSSVRVGRSTSAHNSSNAVDVNRINSMRVDNASNLSNVRSLQNAFQGHGNIRENYGPAFNYKTQSSGMVTNRASNSGIVKQHRNHIHVSAQH